MLSFYFSQFIISFLNLGLCLCLLLPNHFFRVVSFMNLRVELNGLLIADLMSLNLNSYLTPTSGLIQQFETALVLTAF